MLQQTDVAKLARDELNRMAEPVVAAIRPLLVVPHLEERDWDYGPAGQRFLCWIVLEHPASNTGIAYCDEGFGPGSPWGLLFLEGQHLSMGPDSGWYSSLEDAFRESMACDLPTEPGYEVG